MNEFRREFLKLAGGGGLGVAAGAVLAPGAHAQAAPVPNMAPGMTFDVRAFGAKGDGTTLDTAAFQRAIDAANTAGGGTVRVPAGTYACFSVRMKDYVFLYLEPGSTILGAEPRMENGVMQGYEPAEPNSGPDKYQDFGHSHWHDSLIWADGAHDCGILGPGLIWGKGLVHLDAELPKPPLAGAGNKCISFKNCRNVIFRDFSILGMGHFGLMVMAVDNLTIDNVKSDTRRDGFNIDCCKNVRVSNCSINSPWDDGLCLKSSFGLGYNRVTENITIQSCYVSSAWKLGTMLDGTYKHWEKDTKEIGTGGGRIKFGTESNGGFINIAVTNCIFDACEGIAIESVDGAIVEDIAFSNITMRDLLNPPIFIRLGERLRGPKESTQVGRVKRILLSNIVSYNSAGRFSGGGVIGGLPERAIEDVKISDVYVEHRGVGTKEVAALDPPESLQRGPEAHMFGDIPASGFFVRHVRNIEFSNVEIAWSEPDVRPVFWLKDVDGADFFRIKTPRTLTQPVFALHDVKEFRALACRHVADTQLDTVDRKDL